MAVSELTTLISQTFCVEASITERTELPAAAIAEVTLSLTAFGTGPDFGGSSWPSLLAAKNTAGWPSVCAR